MVTYGADMVVLGIYMGIVFMTCAVVILTTIYALRQGLGKTNLWTWKQHKLTEEPQIDTSAEPVPVSEPIEEPVHPTDLEKDGNTPIVIQTSSEVSPASVSPPIEGEQAAIPSPDTPSPEPEPAASHQETTRVSEAEPEQSEPANAELAQSKSIRVTVPDSNKKMVSSTQVIKIKYNEPRQEEAAKLKANEAIPEKTSEPAVSHQETTRVSEAEPEQSEPANAELVQSEPVQPEAPPQETPPKKDEGKETLGDLTDLFSEEILEESDSSKLAGSMNDVDVFHLAADARSLLDNLKKDGSDS